jgi:hydrophobic/amphiphilic exporter-1 (mainly G- bacteria), HAE1 family
VWLTRVSIKNPYFAIVMMLALLLVGLVAIRQISVEQFPNVKFPVVVINTNYRGASPEVVETDVSKPLEEAVHTINGIKTVRSYSFEGQSWVIAEFQLEMDPDLALQDVRDKVSNAAATFRKEIDTPTVSKVNIQDQPIMILQFSSPTIPLREITDWVNEVAKKRLQTIAGVGDVKLVGGVKRQVRINIEPYKIQSLGLSISDVINAIKNANNNYPAGDIRTKNQTISVRLNGKLVKPSDFANIVIAYRNNVPIRISDVATVVDGQDEYSSYSLLDGKPAVALELRQTERANVVDIATDVYAMLDQLNKIKPGGMNVLVSYDQSIAVKRSLSDVEHSLFEGALLTIAIVFVFLQSWRSTVITGLTLPIALVGTIFAIYAFGFTLNLMSLMALSLSVGLLIDDAIVVRENIVRHLHMGKSHYQAALDGTNEIGLAVLATTFTLVAVFLPVGLMHGIIGKFFFQFGITVTVAVLISLLVSFSLDPMLSSIWREPHDGGLLKHSFIGRGLDYFEHYFSIFTLSYERFIRLSLQYKKTTLTIALSLLVGSFLLVPLIGGEFMPKTDNSQYLVSFKTPIGSNISYTAAKSQQINTLLYANVPEIKNITVGIGSTFGGTANVAELTIGIGSKTKRSRSMNKIIQQTRELLGHVGGIEVKNVMPLGAPGGDQQPINIEIKGDNTEILNQIGDNLLKQIAQIKGTTDLSSTYQRGNLAYTINVDRDMASSLGVNLSDVGNTMSALFAGNKVTTWEDPNNGQNYDVVLQIPEDERQANLLDILRVASNKADSSGNLQLVPLSAIAINKPGFSPLQLDRINLQRNITISGNIQGADNQEVFSKIQKILNNTQLPPGYNLTQSGDKEDMEKSFGYAVSSLMIGVAFIYMILTAQFRSFILPLVIMVALPLSFVGVFIALLLFGETLNMFSIIGIIMLMGLATKNGILLVDFINQERRNGVNIIEAIVTAGKVRLRPIVMTSLAMIFGMLPLALSNGDSSEIRKPMAYAIIGGLTTSTLLTLIVVPVVYVYMERFSRFIGKKLNAKI